MSEHAHRPPAEEHADPNRYLEGFAQTLQHTETANAFLEAGTSQGIPGLGVVGGLTNTAMGVHAMIEDPSIDAGLQIAGGAQSAASDAAMLLAGSQAAGQNISNKLGPVGAALDFAGAANNFRKGDTAAGIRDGVAGGLGLVEAPLAAAWKAGWFIGDHTEQLADGYAQRRDLLGDHRGIHDHANDTGDWVNSHLGGGTAGRVAGATTAAVTALADTGYVMERAALSGLGSGAAYVGDAVSGLFGGGGDRTIGEAIELGQSTHTYGEAFAQAAPPRAAAPAAARSSAFEHLLNPFHHYAD